jgi:hypothetical protein
LVDWYSIFKATLLSNSKISGPFGSPIGKYSTPLFFHAKTGEVCDADLISSRLYLI